MKKLKVATTLEKDAEDEEEDGDVGESWEDLASDEVRQITLTQTHEINVSDYTDHHHSCPSTRRMSAKSCPPNNNNNNKSIYIAPWFQMTLFKGAVTSQKTVKKIKVKI